jgi:hypothetical protein
MPDIVHKIDVTSALIHYEGSRFPGSAVQFPPGNTFSDPDLGKYVARGTYGVYQI